MWVVYLSLPCTHVADPVPFVLQVSRPASPAQAQLPQHNSRMVIACNGHFQHLIIMPCCTSPACMLNLNSQDVIYAMSWDHLHALVNSMFMILVHIMRGEETCCRLQPQASASNYQCQSLSSLTHRHMSQCDYKSECLHMCVHQIMMIKSRQAQWCAM